MLAHQHIMRTTLDVDHYVLRAAKELARRQLLSTGQMVCGLLRQAMVGAAQPPAHNAVNVAGFPLFTCTSPQLVTNNHVATIRDQVGI